MGRCHVPDLPNSEISRLIEEWIHSEVGRRVLKRHLIDGIGLEQIAEEIDKSPRQTARIWKRAYTELNKRI